MAKIKVHELAKEIEKQRNLKFFSFLFTETLDKKQIK